MTTTFDLLARGYFPKELPPTFSTLEYANRVVGSIGEIPQSFVDSKRAQLCVHNFSRVGRLRRPLGIPNPVSQHSVAKRIADNWSRIEKLIARSVVGVSTPTPSSDRALVPGVGHLSETKARHRSGARQIVVADIARFYHSVYTHSISWAVHGKEKAKLKRGRSGRGLLGNRLDEAVANCQDGQTIGLPVGPDTSLVLAELVASAVDASLQKRIRGVQGIRFIDDYEIPCRTRREADEVLEALHIALSEYELALNPLKTSIHELPVPIDQVWKTPIRTAEVRDTPKEQATDLIALFDIGYSLAHQYPDKSVLAYVIGRLKDVAICKENAELFQRLGLQCMLSEPGIAAVVLERLAVNKTRGLAINDLELGGLLNDQIVEHAPLHHANEVAWALWGALAFNLQISKRAARALAETSDSVVALSALHAKARGLMHAALDTTHWQSHLTAEHLYGEQWLLSYEAAIKGWLPGVGGKDHIGADANFQWLRDLGVEFYDIDKGAPVVAAGGVEPSWLSDLEELIRARQDAYGENEDGDEQHPDGLADVF